MQKKWSLEGLSASGPYPGHQVIYVSSPDKAVAFEWMLLETEE